MAIVMQQWEYLSLEGVPIKLMIMVGELIMAEVMAWKLAD
jgi:putative effector of murein hydrolase LrgA (UPF0299 family)